MEESFNYDYLYLSIKYRYYFSEGHNLRFMLNLMLYST